MKYLSERVKNIVPSLSISTAEKVKELKSKGINVIDFSWGEPDFPTPSHIKEAAEKALKENFTHYTESRGIKELREAISEKLKKENKIFADPDKEIIVTPGAKQAIVYALLSLIDHFDEVIILEPCWLSYEDAIKISGGVPVKVPSSPEEDFKVDASKLKKYITKKTKCIIFNNPVNPTGVLWKEKEIEEINKIAIEYDLIVISDEIYEKIVFDNLKFSSVASFPGMFERTITVNGFSKTYAMTGWRIGYLVAPENICREILKIHQHISTCATSFAQKGAVAALKGPQKPVEEMVKEYQNRRDLILEILKENKKIKVLKPEGTFYAFLDIRKLKMNSLEASNFFLERYGISLVPGIAYGKSGEGFLRLSFATSSENIKEGIERIKNI